MKESGPIHRGLPGGGITHPAINPDASEREVLDADHLAVRAADEKHCGTIRPNLYRVRVPKVKGDPRKVPTRPRCTVNRHPCRDATAALKILNETPRSDKGYLRISASVFWMLP